MAETKIKIFKDSGLTSFQIEKRLRKLESKNLIDPNRSRESWIKKLRIRLKNRLLAEGNIPSNIIRKNAPEAQFQEIITAQGFTVLKRGWPDFFCWKGDELVLVEVKPDGGEPTPYQRIILEKLATAGLPCYVWTPIRGMERVEPRARGQ